MTTETLDRTDTAADTARQAVSLPASQWRDALAAVLLSAGRDATLPVLMQVRVTVDANSVTLLSTDRYRLTEVTVVTDDGLPGAYTVLLSRDLVERMQKLAKSCKRDAEGLLLPLVVDGERVTFGADVPGLGTVSDRVEFEPDQYPRVDSIMADRGRAPLESVGFNPQYMIDLCKMPGRARNAPARIEFMPDSDLGNPRPILSTWTDGPISYRHLLMPVRAAS